MTNVDLGKFNNDWYSPGNFIKRAIWYALNLLFFKCSVPFPSQFKIFLLKSFGSRISGNVIIKPNVNIKYPWFLEIGENTWIGENVWLDNLGIVKIGKNVCISQGAYLFTGNHNYKKSSFDLIVEGIDVQEGVWIGAKAVICPGVILSSHSVISAGSVVTNDTEPFKIYQGNPATYVRERKIED